jgi:hypothetical protein
MTAALLDFSAHGQSWRIHALWFACFGYMTLQFESKCDLFFSGHPVSGTVCLASSDSTMNEYCIRRDVRRSGPGLIWAAVSVFVWCDRRKPWKHVIVTGLQIWTEVLYSTKAWRNNLLNQNCLFKCMPQWYSHLVFLATVSNVLLRKRFVLSVLVVRVLCAILNGRWTPWSFVMRILPATLPDTS